MFFLGKRVEGDDKFKGLAIETFGISMSAQSYTLPEGSSYRDALHQMGDAHQSIGAAQGELVRPNFSHFALLCHTRHRQPCHAIPSQLDKEKVIYHLSSSVRFCLCFCFVIIFVILVAMLRYHPFKNTT